MPVYRGYLQHNLRFTATEPEVANGHSQIAKVTCPEAFGTPVELTNSGSNYTFTYTMTDRTPGEQTLVIKVEDNFGNESTESFKVFYDNVMPVVKLDVPEHPGLTYFVAWTATDGNTRVASYEAKTVEGIDCDGEGTLVMISGDEKHLELANNGRRFCIHATDTVGNESAWVSGVPGSTHR